MFGEIPALRSRHLDEVADIDACSFPEPMGRESFHPWLGPGVDGCRGRVVLSQGFVVGYTLYRVTSRRLEVRRIAVAPDCRREGHGSSLLAALVRFAGNRPVRLSVPDSLLPVHLWLRACGFRCVAVERASRGDRYRFEFAIAKEVGVR